MTDWKILITDRLESAGQEILRAGAQVDDHSGIQPEQLIEEISRYDAVIVRSRTRLTEAVFEAAKGLKVAGRAGVGVDNIDLAAAQSHKVVVVNSPISTTLAVAEHTLALMLSLAREIPRADSAIKSGGWPKNDMVGVELAGKTLGILGAGRIGSEVASRAAAFGMVVLGYDPLLSDIEIRERGLQPVSLADLYARADFISLHLPLEPETRSMIDGQALARMKRGVRLISAARGGLIDEVALTAALDSGQVGGAALDVFAQEPPGLSALAAHPRVVATPHLGAQTEEALERTARDIAEEVIAALNGEPLRWRVV
ncbi:MAG TPA: hydroxyacid dehydrogenase [Anaerolineales bacterium]|nr:hydroxyacid dehydrogenase [Anaerolineales bacterium]